MIMMIRLIVVYVVDGTTLIVWRLVDEYLENRKKMILTSLDLCNSSIWNKQKWFEKPALLNKFSPTSLNYYRIE